MSAVPTTTRFQYSDELMARVRAAAAETVDGSLIPWEVSYRVLSECWDDLDEDDRFHLALAGVDDLCSDARSALRRKRPSRPVVSMLRAKEEPTYTREEVETIHASIRCPFETHSTSYSKREACVGDILRLRGEEREQAISARREAAEQNERKFREGVKRAVDGYVLSVLRQINLVGADGRTKTLDVFTMNDVAYWETRSKAHADTWRVRQGWFDDAKRALGEHGVETLGELPSIVGNGLADRAAEIWSEGGER